MLENGNTPETTRGGLDRYLGPPAGSILPDTPTETDPTADSPPDPQCNLVSPSTDDPLCQLAEAVRQKQSNPVNAPRGQ